MTGGVQKHMCQATMSSPCDRCGGGYSAGLDNYISHTTWCHDDEVVRQHQKAAEQRRQDWLHGCY